MSASRPVARLMQRYRAAEALEVVAARQLAALRQGDASGGGGGGGVNGLPDEAAEGEGHITPPLGEPGPRAGGEAGAAAAAAGGLDAAAAAGMVAEGGAAGAGGGAGGGGSTVGSLRLLEICLGTLANLVATQPLQLQRAGPAGGGGDGGEVADGGGEPGSAADGGLVVAASGLLTLLLAPPADADTDAAAATTAAASAPRDIAASGGGGGGGVAAAAPAAAAEAQPVVVWDAETAAAALGGGAWGGLLWLDDARVLCELCRLCSVALRAAQVRAQTHRHRDKARTPQKRTPPVVRKERTEHPPAREQRAVSRIVSTCVPPNFLHCRSS